MEPGAAARFAEDWARTVPPAGRIGLAVSGGPDSFALLILAHAVAPSRIVVATVDHGLRPAARGEAEAVAQHAAALGLGHAILTVKLVSGPALQERARTARYAVLGDWARAEGLAGIATAHHADDQAETLVMRLNRGAGLRGLAGMRPVAAVPGHPDLALLRPLLGWRRAELLAVVASAGMAAADDPSNRDMRFERARTRAALASAPWLDPAALARSAGHLAEADAAIEWMVDQAWRLVHLDGKVLSWTPGDLPRVVALRVLERIAAQHGRSTPRGQELARWHDALASGGIATLAGLRGDGRGAEWRFIRVPAPKSG